MISEISAWVKGIVMVVIFATFLELLLPTSSMQRFIRVIMGLFIMLAIMNPLIAILQSSWTTAEQTVFMTVDGNQSNTWRAVNQSVENHSKITNEMYRQDVARQVRSLVMAVEGVAEARVTVETDTQKGPGFIRMVTIYIQPGHGSNIRKVDKVAIQKEGAEDMSQELSDALIGKVRRAVMELMGFSSNQIAIRKLK